MVGFRARVMVGININVAVGLGLRRELGAILNIELRLGFGGNIHL